MPSDASAPSGAGQLHDRITFEPGGKIIASAARGRVHFLDQWKGWAITCATGRRADRLLLWLPDGKILATASAAEPSPCLTQRQEKKSPH
jgi:hypothetical protein